MYLTYQKAQDEATDATNPALSQVMYKAAHELFMPAISSYLNH
jgi:maltose-binding protein MalE